MKKYFLFIVFNLLIINILNAQSNAKISGKILNTKKDSIAITFYTPLGAEPEVYRVAINKQGNFEINFNASQVLAGTLENLPLLISPNDNFHIEYDDLKQAETIKFKGGKGAKENTFYVENDKKFSTRFLYRRMNTASPEEFLQFADSFANAKLKKYEEASKAESFSKEFDMTYRNHVLYSTANAKIYAGSYMHHFQPNKKIEIPDEFYKFLKNINIQADSLLQYPDYQDFISNYISNRYDFLKLQAQTPKQTNIDFSKEQYLLANMLLSGKTADFVRTKIIKDGLGYAKWQKAEQLYEMEKTNYPTNEYLPMLTKVYQKLKKLAPGQPAPLFTFKSIEGKTVSLSDFKGKVVYLDIWASWCGPCIEEIPHAKKLKERMKGKDVIFLYVSIDENEKSWREMVAKKEMEGVHLIATGGWESQINKLYGVNGVPTYFIVGRDGKIFNNRPPRPSSPNVDRELEEALANN